MVRSPKQHGFDEGLGLGMPGHGGFIPAENLTQKRLERLGAV